MADFIKAFIITLRHEGGYLLHHVPGDRGGQTFAGISRVNHETWPGWGYIDVGNIERAKFLVPDFYQKNFWDKIRGDSMRSQRIANLVYDTAVNMGVRTASKLIQRTIGVRDDGTIGPVTINRINEIIQEPTGEQVIINNFTLRKMNRRIAMIKKYPDQKKFMVGWTRRDLSYVSNLEVA